jgi:hypothetical protein
LLQGLLLILVIIYLPQGIVDSLTHRWKLRRASALDPGGQRQRAHELPSA